MQVSALAARPPIKIQTASQGSLWKADDAKRQTIGPRSPPKPVSAAVTPKNPPSASKSLQRGTHSGDSALTGAPLPLLGPCEKTMLGRDEGRLTAGG